MIYLLDLNYTLVENSLEKKSPFTKQIDGEKYREKLINALSGKTVFLLTARPDQHRAQTLKSIKEKTGWYPDKAFFNVYRLPPAQAKEQMLLEIRAEFPNELLYGLESNPKTRAMYASYGIDSATWDGWLNEQIIKNT